jgi:hypothetical protein
MKKILLLSIFSLNACLAQGPADIWYRNYGGTEDEFGKSIIKTNDGGLLIAGSTDSLNGDVIGIHRTFPNSSFAYADFWIVKLNSNGDIQWQKCLGGRMGDAAASVVELSSGGYIVGGSSHSNDGDVTFHCASDSFSDAWFVKLDILGNVVWQKTYGGGQIDTCASIDITNDGGIIATGRLDADFNCYTVPITYNQSPDYWVLRLDANGERVWDNHYGGENGDSPYCIKTTSDGGFIIAGGSASHYGDVVNSIGPMNAAINDFWILKLNSIGIIEWQKSFGGLSADWATNVALTSDGGYIVVGNTASFNTGTVTNFHGEIDGLVIKLSATGIVEWQKCYGGSSADYFNSVKQTVKGGFIICGNTDSSNGDLAGITTGNKAWIIKLNSAGNISWQRHYMYGHINSFEDIIQNPDGTFNAVGRSYLYTEDESKLVVVKLWNETLSNDDLFLTENVILSPNPVNDVLYIQSNGINIKEGTIYGTDGRKVDSYEITDNRINIQGLSKGLYLLEIKNENNQSLTKKFVKN